MHSTAASPESVPMLNLDGLQIDSDFNALEVC